MAAWVLPSDDTAPWAFAKLPPPGTDLPGWCVWAKRHAGSKMLCDALERELVHGSDLEVIDVLLVYGARTATAPPPPHIVPGRAAVFDLLYWYRFNGVACQQRQLSKLFYLMADPSSPAKYRAALLTCIETIMQRHTATLHPCNVVYVVITPEASQALLSKTCAHVDLSRSVMFHQKLPDVLLGMTKRQPAAQFALAELGRLHGLDELRKHSSDPDSLLF